MTERTRDSMLARVFEVVLAVVVVLAPSPAEASSPLADQRLESQHPDGSAGTWDGQASDEAHAAAEKMLAAIGGRERWKALSALYIRARHSELRLPDAYVSEIWRNIGIPQFKIVQTGKDFESIRIVDGDRHCYVRDGEERVMSPELVDALRHWDRHLLYRVFHQIARVREDLVLQIGPESRLKVLEDGKWLATLHLDEDGIPRRMTIPTRDGKGSSFTDYPRWERSDGYLHPVISIPEGGGTVYHTLEWIPMTDPYPDDTFFTACRPERADLRN